MPAERCRGSSACHHGLGSYSLDALLTHLHIPNPTSRHRALPDASFTTELFIRLLTGGAATHGWSQLAQLRNSPACRHQPPQWHKPPCSKPS